MADQRDDAPAPLDAELAPELADLARRGLARRTEDVSVGVDFTSNDYLGLARDPALVAAAREAAEREGVGARAARLLAERLPSHERAETLAAEWLGAEAALLFPSGYQANVGLIGALAGRGDLIVSDVLNHASLIDAARLSRAAVAVHRHLDLDDVERLLVAGRGARRRLVVTEAVFSMDGTRAPLAELHELCARHDAWLTIDEAHSVGLLGPRGAGAWAAAAAEGADGDRVAARLVAGGKALGSAGALVVGRRSLRELLVHRARSFIFSTAPPPSLAATLAAAIERAADADDRRARCRAVAAALAEGLGVAAPPAAILPLVVGDPEPALSMADTARRAGFAVRAVRPPTVPAGTSRLRLVAHAHNTVDEARALARVLAHARAAAPPRGAPTAPVTTAPARRAPLYVVAGTDTDVGKTVVSALALAAALEGGPAGYWKPVQTGDDDDTSEVRRLASAPGATFVEPLRRYPLPASPHEAAADAGDEFPVEALGPRLAELLRGEPERWILELAGGVHVPLTDDRLQSDWLAELKAPVLLAARSGLGTLNHTLLTVEALRARDVPIAALLLVGPPHPSNTRTLTERAGIPHVFTVAPFDPLDPAAVAAWVATATSHAGARLADVLGATAVRPVTSARSDP